MGLVFTTTSRRAAVTAEILAGLVGSAAFGTGRRKRAAAFGAELAALAVVGSAFCATHRFGLSRSVHLYHPGARGTNGLRRGE